LGHGNEENISVPCYIPDLEKIRIIKFAAGCEHSTALSSIGEMYAWGHGDGGRLGLGNNTQCFTPTIVHTLDKMKIR
jgi:alpha-tubulin suppressor-like RCC1 family protein